MMRAFGLPHFGQTSRWGAGTFGVLLRLGRRSAWMESGCIGVPPIISKSRRRVRRILLTVEVFAEASPAVPHGNATCGRINRTP